MSTYVFARNGMGDYTTGTGMREDMLMQAFNILNHESGVILGGDLLVTERAAGANMSVDVAPGRCFIGNSSYVANTANNTRFWGMLSDAVVNLPISTNTSGSTRYDLIIGKIDTVPAANAYATNVGSVEVVEGTPGAGQPATPSNSELFGVLEIPDGTTTQIVDADITDSRKFLSLTLENGRLYLGETTASASNDPIIRIDTDNYDLSSGDPAVLIQGSNNHGGVHLKTYGAASTPTFHGLNGRGSVAAPTATQSGDPLVQLRGDGIDNAAAETGLQGSIKILAAENFTTTAQGTKATIGLTPTGSVTPADIVTISGDGDVGINMIPEASLDVVNGATIESVTNVAARFRASASAAADAGVLIGATNGNAPFITDASGGGTSIGMRYASSTGDVVLDPAANGDVVLINKMTVRDATVTVFEDTAIARGWAYVTGASGVSPGSMTVTLPLTFASTEYDVMVQPYGAKTTAGVPSNRNNINLAHISYTSAQPFTTSSFYIELYSDTAFVGSYYYLYSFIVMGPK